MRLTAFINLPVVLLALTLGAAALPRSPTGYTMVKSPSNPLFFRSFFLMRFVHFFFFNFVN
jgi:uncharacterized RDD family membrane protein YckC